VLLDALGTLIALEPPAPRLAAELRRRFGLEISRAQAQRAVAAEISYYRAHLEEGRDRATLAELRSRCAEVLADQLATDLGGPVPRGAELVEALLASLHFTVFADVADALAELRELGVRLVVASNWDVSLAEVLDRLEVTRWLDGVLTCAEVGVRKPDPAVFVRALAMAGVSPERALHVGDSLQEDVEGARAAGIEPVLIARDRSDVPAPGEDHAIIHSLRELPRLVFA
jgi:putative hydrolase of the HAD superfamily